MKNILKIILIGWLLINVNPIYSENNCDKEIDKCISNHVECIDDFNHCREMLERSTQTIQEMAEQIEEPVDTKNSFLWGFGIGSGTIITIIILIIIF